MTPETEALLSGYAAGILTERERQRLFQAALEDDEVFEALAAEMPVRALLSEEAVRQELLAALEKPRLQDRLLSWMPARGPALAAAAGTLAVVLAVLWLVPQTDRTPDSPTLPWPSPTASAKPGGWRGMTPVIAPDQASAHARVQRRLFGLPARQPFRARLSLTPEAGRFAVGSRVRVEFSVDRESNVIILEKRSDGSIERLFPNPSSPFPRVKTGVEYQVPDQSAAPRELTEPLGPRSLRLVAFPPGTDPITVSPGELRLIEADLTVVEADYEIVGQSP